MPSPGLTRRERIHIYLKSDYLSVIPMPLFDHLSVSSYGAIAEHGIGDFHKS